MGKNTCSSRSSVQSEFFSKSAGEQGEPAGFWYAMTISTRTPEGWPAKCPICGHEICVDPSQPAGDAPCPRCGSLVWTAPNGPERATDKGAASLPPRSLVWTAPNGPERRRKWYAGVLVIGILFVLVSTLLWTVWQVPTLFGLSWTEIVVLGIIALLLFGKRLPAAARAMGSRAMGFWLHRRTGKGPLN
jgi:hypothetical protein